MHSWQSRHGRFRRGSRPTLGVGRVEDLGPALLDLRLSQEVTQADVSEAMDKTHPTTIGAWENRRSIPTMRKVIELLATYDYQMVLMHKRTFEDLVRPRAADGAE